MKENKKQEEKNIEKKFIIPRDTLQLIYKQLVHSSFLYNYFEYFLG